MGLNSSKWIPPLLGGIALLASPIVNAASCCGGGSASALIMPKLGDELFAATLDVEQYNGVWRDDGTWVADPSGYDLNQYRLNLGYALRTGDRWQVSANLPLVFNSNHYEGISSDTSGIGDMTFSLLYENFDNVTCVYQVTSIEDLIPAVYFGMSLTAPTGISPYDDVGNSFDITGRGFYRLDGTVQVEKTIFPWNALVSYTYGHYLERPVNREYGRYVEPYDKQLGDRNTYSVSFGRTWQTEEFNAWTGTLAYSDMSEKHASIDGNIDPTSGLRKRSVSFTVAWANAPKSWIFKATWNHSMQRDGWGENFPTTDILSIGVNYVR